MTRKSKPAADTAAPAIAPGEDIAPGADIAFTGADVAAEPAAEPSPAIAPDAPAGDPAGEEPITHPTGGGSWLRAPDGTLTRQEG